MEDEWTKVMGADRPRSRPPSRNLPVRGGVIVNGRRTLDMAPQNHGNLSHDLDAFGSAHSVWLRSVVIRACLRWVSIANVP